MYDEPVIRVKPLTPRVLFRSNAAWHLTSPDEASSSGTRDTRPIRKRDMTALFIAEVALPSPKK